MPEKISNKLWRMPRAETSFNLRRGLTFNGNFALPQKSCDDSHWIIIRTSAPDSSLPPEGTRLLLATRAFLPCRGDPAFHALLRNMLSKIEFDGKAGSGPITFAAGANHYRLMGLEVTRGAFTNPVYNLVSLRARLIISSSIDSGCTARPTTKLLAA